MRELLRTLRGRFDYVIVDTPPALAVTDATLVGALVDGVVLTLRSRKVTRDEARLVRDRLRQADIKILGAVLNRYRALQAGVARGYRYAEAYGYGAEESGRRRPGPPPIRRLILMIDLHCHILPGVDDGAPTLEDALAMCRLAADDGCEAMVATPHQRREPWWNDDVARLRRARRPAPGEGPGGGRRRVPRAPRRRGPRGPRGARRGGAAAGRRRSCPSPARATCCSSSIRWGSPDEAVHLVHELGGGRLAADPGPSRVHPLAGPRTCWPHLVCARRHRAGDRDERDRRLRPPAHAGHAPADRGGPGALRGQRRPRHPPPPSRPAPGLPDDRRPLGRRAGAAAGVRQPAGRRREPAAAGLREG